MKDQTKHFLSSRALLIAIVLGCLLFAVGLTAFSYFLPSQGAHTSSRNYGYVYSGAKSSSVEFNTSSDAPDSILLFGSSELSTPASIVPQVPAEVFGKNDYGLNLTYIGEALDQSLWHAIASGAYADYTNNKKAVIIASLGWFEDGGIDNETFGMRFSYSLYRAFCDNPNISDESKAYVAQRLAEQGINDSVIQAGLRTAPMDFLNDAIYSAMDDIKLRQELTAVREKGIEKDPEAAEQEVDWVALREQALEDAKASSTNNKWHLQDDYYTENLADRIEDLRNSKTGETYTNTPEYNDFTALLKICKEVGLEPLVIISPVHGEFFDYRGISKTAREQCYERMRSICEAQDIAYADFSDREYEDYFLFDIVHFGGPGWVDLEEAIYEYAK